MSPPTPKTKATGNEQKTSNLPKIAKGLPQPGRRIIKQMNTPPAMPTIAAAILPKCVWACFIEYPPKFAPSLISDRQNTGPVFEIQALYLTKANLQGP
jgi:hypothetical protein